jgi:hypothetical protein
MPVLAAGQGFEPQFPLPESGVLRPCGRGSNNNLGQISNSVNSTCGRFYFTWIDD